MPMKWQRWLRLLCLTSFLLLGFASAGFSQGSDNQSADFQLLAESATAAREAGKTDDAIRSYQQALTLRADWEEGWWYLGTLQYDADHLKEAVPAFRNVVKLNPAQVDAWNFFGLCEFGAGDYEGSLQHLQKARELGPGDDPEVARVALYHLALLLNRNGEFGKAWTILATSLTQQASPQIKVALGLNLLHVPLLPQEVGPSSEALVAAAGETAAILTRGDPQKTRRSFQTLLHDYPETPYLHYAYGLALSSAGQNTEALAQQREELRVAPENELAQNEISRLDPSSRHSTEVRRSNARPKQAALRDPRMIERYGRPTVAGGSPAPPNAAWNLAMTAYQEKRYADAISSLKTVVQHEPDFGSAWAVMGLSEFELKDYKSSLLHLERGEQLGLKGSTDSVQLAKYHLAILLNQSGAFDRARNLLALEASTQSHAPEIQFLLGMTLLRIPLYPEDVEVSRRALVQSAGEVAALLLESKYDAALPKFQTLLRQHPDTPFLHYAYGTALASLSQYDEAEVEFRCEQTVSPKSELPYLRLAAIQLRLGHATEALPSAKHAVELAADSAEAHYLLGRTYLDLGQTDAAVSELDMASRMTPGSPEVHFNLAKAYAKAKRPDKEAEERVIFARLNTLAEQNRGEHGDQSYDGPRDSNSIQGQR